MTTNEPRETLVTGLPLRGAHDGLKLLDALDKAGKLGRDTRDLSLQLGQAPGSLAGRLLTSGRITNVSAAARAAFHQPLFLELRVGVLHGHQGYAEPLGVGPSTGKPVTGAERPGGDFVSDPRCDLAGVELPLRL